jgi:hypothetical protein
MLPSAADKIGGTRYRPDRRYGMSEDAAKTPFKTNAELVPEGVRSERNPLRTVSEEIAGETVAPRLNDSVGPPRQTDVGVDEPQWSRP